MQIKLKYPALISFICLIVLLLLTPKSVFAQDFSLVNTPAAQAFIAKNYSLALTEFNKLAEQRPNDLTVKRYQAICLDRLERPDEAVEILQQILLISTQAASVHYHLGTIYYKLQQSELAEQHFGEVVSLASGSKYDELAQVYLNAIANQRFNFLNPGAPRRWGFYGLLGFSDDLGSRIAFDGQDRAGNRISAYASASYYFLRNERWTGTVGLSLFHSQHSHDSLSDDDFEQWGLRTTLQKQSQLAGKPTIYRFSLNYRTSDFGDREYSKGFSGYFNSRIRFTENTATSFYLSYGQEKLDPLTSFNRDLFLTRRNLAYAGVNHSVYLRDRTIELGTGMFANHNDANSDNFNRLGFGAKVFGRFTLPYKMQLRMSITYRDDEYTDFTGDDNRGFDSMYYSAGLSRRLSKNFSLNLIYRKYDIDSTEQFGDVDNSSVGLNLSYVY